MRREVKILAVTALAGAAWAGRAPLVERLDQMDLFRVTEVRVHGLRYLDQDEAIALMGLTPESSIWGDVEAWATKLQTHPLVRAARVRRRIPGRLDVEVTERVPVALVPTPTLEPVDADGGRLPLDPAVARLDLPLLRAGAMQPTTSRLFPERVRALAAEIARLEGADTVFLRMASEVGWYDRTSLVVRWARPSVDLVLPRGAPAARLTEGLVALADASARRPENPPATVDLRFADQVVVRSER